MHVDQKHVTTIRLHDAKGGDIQLMKDGKDYRLQLSSETTIVNISLGLEDMRKLCQQMVQMDMDETWKPHIFTPEYRAMFFPGTPGYLQEAMARWFARQAAAEPAQKVS